MARRPDRAADRPPLEEGALRAVADRFRVLGTESRLRILNALMPGPRTVGALVGPTGLEPSNLSRQVAALEQAGCVRRTRQGREVLVEIADPSLRELCDVVCASLRRQAAEDLEALGGGA